MFNKESAWVRAEGYRLEQCFSLLRAETEVITEMRRKLNILHSLDRKYFDLSVLSTLDFSSMGRPADCIVSAATLLNAQDDDNDDN